MKDDINNIDLAYGLVTNVKTIPSRNVTRIEIEIPAESHIAATTILYGKGALVIPMWQHEGKVITYGIRKLGMFTGTMAANDDATPGEPERPARLPQPPRPAARHPVQPASRPEPPVPPPGRIASRTQQAGMMCRDNQLFWRFLSHKTNETVTCEDDAATALKMVLDIDSRRELDTNVKVQREFEALLREFNAFEPVPF